MAESYSVAHGYEVAGSSLILGQKADSSDQVQLSLAMMNRHGFVAGSTGSGKTRTAQHLIEQLSRAGVPVVVADAKGDLTRMAVAGELSEPMRVRAERVGQTWTPSALPVEFLKFGSDTPSNVGTAVRTGIGSLGYKLLGRVLRLTPDQQNCLTMAHIFCRDHAMPLDTIQDLLKALQVVRESGIGGVTSGVVDRTISKLTIFGEENSDFFGGPHFDVMDLVRTVDGWGMVSLFDISSGLGDDPEIFTTFLLWALRELMKAMPEVGDEDKPRLVFFFDEAHKLFSNSSKEFIRTVADTVKLVRSRGIGVFFITQSASDLPTEVLSQLANRVQHVLRAYTPDERLRLKQTAASFPQAEINVIQHLQVMKTGQAIVTVMAEDGAPTPPVCCDIRVPRSGMGRLDNETRAQLVMQSELAEKYYQMTLDLLKSRQVTSEPEPVFGAVKAVNG